MQPLDGSEVVLRTTSPLGNRGTMLGLEGKTTCVVEGSG